MGRSFGARSSSTGPSSQRRGLRAAALAALLILSVFLAACGSGSGGSSSAGGAETSEQAAGEPVRGGVLTFARSVDADVGLNPINAPSNGSIFIIQQIFDQLVEIGAGPEVEPGLASSWASSKDGL